jgi:hypothetical protein
MSILTPPIGDAKRMYSLRESLMKIRQRRMTVLKELRGGHGNAPRMRILKMSSRNAAPLTRSQEELVTDEHTTQTLSARDIALLEKYKLERDKRIRADGLAQFRRTDGELAHFLEDPYVETPLNRAPMEDEADVVVVGGGWSGMLTALRLREAGVDNIRIIESGSDFGGVWYWNRYPGCKCDVDSFIYIPLVEETGYMPTEKYAKSEEIRAHARAIGIQFDLYRHAVFQTRVTQLRWDEHAARWIRLGQNVEARLEQGSDGQFRRDPRGTHSK